jgi:hypothetical protein
MVRKKDILNERLKNYTIETDVSRKVRQKVAFRLAAKNIFLMYNKVSSSFTVEDISYSLLEKLKPYGVLS